ncbi:putative baseplate assembly protein [Burkholderiales bacterium 8X]|nr:putative baseplate assembly protein [Burkholderiales bacterium 8X]
MTTPTATTRFHCCDERRLAVLQQSGSANAIEFVEVLDKSSPPSAPRQQTLFVRLLRPGFALVPANLRIDGGERIDTVGILWAAAADALPPEAEAGLVDTLDELARTLVVRTDGSGDFSRYTLSIVSHAGGTTAPADFDPRLSHIDFSFKVECPSDFDCKATDDCPAEPKTRVDIDYLAKDYQGFRRLMLDRLALQVPDWTERSGADLGITLVELLAYAADNLSYRQDAIANEAYLGTARQRISVRRHARLVDYLLHEGCNARAFVQIEVAGDNVLLPAGTQLLTRVPRTPLVLAPESDAWHAALAAGAQVFETAHDALLDRSLDRLAFHTWGDQGCCLPRGSTRATLRGHATALQVGDLLVFEERISPSTFAPEDADRTHRWAVRITERTLGVDPSGGLFDFPAVDEPVDVTEVAWDAADALPFALCLSVTERPGLEISVALGNIVLVDHGLTLADEALGRVPAARLQLAPAAASCAGCDPVPPRPVPPRFRPTLAQTPLSQGFDLGQMLAVPIDEDEGWWPASALLAIDPRQATPRIVLTAQPDDPGALPQTWAARRDLLSSSADSDDFVVEVDDDGRASLRFGDDRRGRRPDSGTSFRARYRIGNGTAGNVGADSIGHIVSNTAGVFTAVRNPMPAAGGIGPEDIEAARRDAPEAFRTQERAVTPADYAAAAERRPDVQRAAATFRWTGSWHTVFVTPDRFGGLTADAAFTRRLRRFLERFRMAGYDLDVSAPRPVPLDLALHVCVQPGYSRAEVLRSVQAVLSCRVLADGTLGVFHPDRFSFGQPVYLSSVIAAAQAVEGVDSVRPDAFGRLGVGGAATLDQGVIPIGALEIAQLAGNPNFPERGRLRLTAGGGL